jgi:hypothetical protein
LPDVDCGEVWARTHQVPVGSTSVRVAGAADHLRLLAFHALKHGVWRPLWLVDLGALLHAGHFDTDVLRGRDPRLQRWLACALGLARELLDADTAALPPELGHATPPPWTATTVLTHWSRPHRSLPVVQWRDVSGPRRAWATFFDRVPDPIEATFWTNSEFTGPTPRMRQGRTLAGKLVRFAANRIRTIA